ncbi:hypothetical protein KIN20_026884 [Parelaphostrongylus tenuis]|uniref:Uncharacterized protein n=1 Tax=Parelaphostrongylus tenuis TaxID=148309 RepID=A0AAD5QYW2_PARTN|nr:hypothetical protein KIN20_026883 [Parelaphostrongylus tenuis]KAJ1366269.1 hypothetical protein KIN20_026884 [Parelaphostrongylus tenuis]
MRKLIRRVFDVLERQGRSALLPDAVISAILGQLSVTISYTPLNCQKSSKPHEQLAVMQQSVCIIVDNRVTGICTTKAAVKMCGKPEVGMVEVSAIISKHLTISETLTTTNVIMANWLRMMWQCVVDRTVRMLASGPFGSHFFSARATVGGN